MYCFTRLLFFRRSSYFDTSSLVRKYDRKVLSRVAFIKRFMYDVMLSGRLYEKDVFVQLSQMFAET